MQNKLVVVFETRDEEGEGATVLRSSTEDGEGKNTRVECNEIFLLAQANVEDDVRKGIMLSPKLAPYRGHVKTEGETSHKLNG